MRQTNRLTATIAKTGGRRGRGRGRGWRAFNAWRDLDSLVRLNLFFFSGCLPLLGAATVGRALSGVAVAGLLVVALGFHAFAYILNDVVDLPADRHNPWRRFDPMVRGALARRSALAIACAAALAAVPPALALGGAWGVLALVVGYACIAIYDLYGKRTRVPPLTDAVQGLAWACLLLVGAAAAAAGAGQVAGEGGVGGGGGGEALAFDARTWIAFAHTVLFVLAMNGVHGGLRDLGHDLAQGARTTAVLLGARPDGDGRVRVTGALRAFATVTTLAVVASITVPLLAGALDDTGTSRANTVFVIVFMDAGIIALLVGIVKPARSAWSAMARMHIVLMFALLPVALWAGMAWSLRLGVLTAGGVSVAALVASDTWFKISPDSPNYGGVLK